MSSDKPAASSLASAENSGSDDKKASTIWVERYRPKSLEDVSHQSEVVATLQNAVTMNRPLPHLLLYGPPGSGKVRSSCVRDIDYENESSREFF